jgi:GMP synthase (glutamine-hydrolysing)
MSYENFPIAVVDNGGQWTHREYRVLNYLGCRADIVSNVTPIEELERFKALVLSGGAPRIETESEALGLTSEYIDSEKWPILGICVGHQYMANHFGGKAGPAEIPEFGSSLLTLIDEGWILAGFPKEFNVWESHNDEVYEMPNGFRLMASSDACQVQVIQHEDLPYAGVQYHPEVEHSEYGSELFQNFLNKAQEWNKE